MHLFSLEMFENIAYVMAKHADPSIPDNPEEWLDEFNTFSIYQVLPKLIELLFSALRHQRSSFCSRSTRSCAKAR